MEKYLDIGDGKILPLPMFVIFEGPDNIGKGTQIKLFHTNILFMDMIFQTLHYSGLPFKHPEDHIEYSERLYDDMFKMMSHSVNFTNRSFVFDRSHIGEMVYAPLYRHYSGDYVLDIEKKYLDFLNKHLYVIALAGTDMHKRDDGKSFYKNEEEALKENTQFMKAYANTGIKNKVMLFVDGFSPGEIHHNIMGFFRECAIDKPEDKPIMEQRV